MASKSIVHAAIWIAALLLASALISVFFEEKFAHASTSLINKVGNGGMVLSVALSDFLASPIPTDVVIFLIAKSPNPEGQWLLMLTIGVVSTIVGTLGYLLGRHFLKPQWFGQRFVNLIQKRSDVIDRYGKWGVALGALTPVPFSFACWGAGLVKMKFWDFFQMCLLRIPRTLIFYGILISQ